MLCVISQRNAYRHERAKDGRREARAFHRKEFPAERWRRQWRENGRKKPLLMEAVAPARREEQGEARRGRSGVKTAFRSHGVERKGKRFQQQVEETRRRAQILQLALEERGLEGGGKGRRGAEKEGNDDVGGEMVELREGNEEMEEGRDEVSVAWEEKCGEKESQQREGCEDRRLEVGCVARWDGIHE